MTREHTASSAGAIGPLLGVGLVLVALYRPGWIMAAVMAYAHFWDTVATPVLVHWILGG